MARKIMLFMTLIGLCLLCGCASGNYDTVSATHGENTFLFPGDADVAYKLKAENPEIVLAGERGGKIMPGFDLGNSPSELQSVDVSGKTVVHTTSAGTQGIALVKKTSGAKFFDPAQNDVFPEKDFELCTQVDCFDFVLRLNKDSELPYMEKI